ncbi:MAG: hypothetical protein HUJ96_08345 [Marinilabiliaceae bacterium]|nr:hypothetical protein [Marinilabiliaceae bacterium]
MKRIVIIFAMLLSMTAVCFGQYSTTEGDAKPLKEGGDLVVTFDFEGATFDKSQALSDKYENLTSLVSKVPANFKSGFSETSKKSKIVDNASDAKYDVNIKVTNMDLYFKVMSVVPGNVTKVWATITIKDIATGELICTIDVDECAGERDFTIDDSFAKCFVRLGEDFGTIVKKGKAK